MLPNLNIFYVISYMVSHTNMQKPKSQLYVVKNHKQVTINTFIWSNNLAIIIF